MFEIFGINFHLYGLLIGLGIWVAMEIAIRHRGDIKQEVLEKSILWAVIGGVVGARIYHVIDFWSGYYSTNLIKVLYFWEGGLGIWGAIIGGALGLVIFSYLKKIRFLKLMDVLVIGMPLAQAIGRVGNFVNGELMGKNGEPLFAYEGVLNLILFAVLIKEAKKVNRTGLLSGIYLSGYGIIRLVLENLRPTDTIWKIMDVPVAIIFSLIAILSGIFLIFRGKQS